MIPTALPPTALPPTGAHPAAAAPAAAPPTGADPALRETFLGLLRTLAAAHRLDPDDLEQQVWLRAAAEPRASLPVARLRALTLQEFQRARAEAEAEALTRCCPAQGRPARAAPEEASPEHRALAADQARALRAAAARLPSRCPDLVAALLESPVPGYQELAEELSIPRGSIGPTRARCLACLRRLLLRAGYGRPEHPPRPVRAAR
ncbi:sigma-70 family RNA polymerase sigma factor [Streptacidiphilus sp. PB12-B1b]|uniref:sigma-70 family RNA polymerase sigma factor n=1 Tax=Streptacidiphilus sp. PB12-B1b TaxID=2705012 RepID=UPI0015F7E4D4|nr:sigma-70 family RNA polymerase sigma factor [Streptacidiphilus sp. PB12-B1b]QMU76371.1 sigma-70 family RNA polymerase sigma factor [Streptacidiphilus sp. PB12-B1b]